MTESYGEIIATLADGALVLTANKRLFRYLRGCFDQQMLAAGKLVWDTPQLSSYQGWLLTCLSELGESWRLLNPQQQLYLWEQLVESSSRTVELELLQVAKTAEKALQAYQLLNEYELSLEGQPLTEDQLIFQGWCRRYRSLAAEQQWLDQSDLPRLLVSALGSGRLVVPERILLVGFDQLSPGLERLQAQFRAMGKRCDEVSLASKPAGSMVRFAAKDSDHEIESAARWARLLLEQGATSIGVVVPDLSRRRSRIERVFAAQIDPVGAVQLAEDEAIFSLSLGGPLAEQGVIHAGLELLSLPRILTIQQASTLLRSPFLGGAHREADARARFDLTLRGFGQQTISVAKMRALAENRPGLAELVAILQQLEAFSAESSQRLPGVWAELFAAQLHDCGWPGERTLSSREYQALTSFQENVLLMLPHLDALHAPVGRAQALSLVRRLARDCEFQVESPTGPVQVIGLLESTGLQFDHLWVMGLGETVLPAPPQPNPFIPYQLQVQERMPHANAERELAYAEQVMARLAAAAERVVFSYPCSDGDTQLRESPLIPDAAVIGEPELAEPRDPVHLAQQRKQVLETAADQRGPALEQRQVEGGTGLLKDQAHCPFRAFVHHRLFARAFDEAAAGISPMVRGDLVHIALERIWTRLQDRDQLVRLSAPEVQTLAAEQVAEALATFFAQRPAPGSTMLALEQERVTSLVVEWLEEVEMKRDFFRVVELEHPHVEQLGPLEISMQIDRVDELADGYRIVIDYKTGSQLRADDFVSAPLVEPQLPIYAVAQQDAPADGIVFAQVRKGHCRLLGVVREKGLLGRVRELSTFGQCEDLGIADWNQLLVFWQQQIRQLATDFVAGEAAVRPFDPQSSCLYCDLPGLCRIREALAEAGVADDC